MSETIADIIREMRELSNAAHDKEAYGSIILDVWSLLYNLADRLEAAYEQEKCKWAASITKQRSINKELVDDMAAKDEEIKKLRAARDLWFSRADELRVRCDELYAELKKEVK